MMFGTSVPRPPIRARPGDSPIGDRGDFCPPLSATSAACIAGKIENGGEQNYDSRDPASALNTRVRFRMFGAEDAARGSVRPWIDLCGEHRDLM
jgi:hypothetical protein